MAHFARLNEINQVLNVVVVANEVITDENGVEQEQLGIDFLTELNGGIGWYKQTSYNGAFRKNFAGKDSVYNTARDAFISLQPYTSWTLNETTCRWEAPIARPDDGKAYTWDEQNQAWVEMT
jgi:hypothetical protein